MPSRALGYHVVRAPEPFIQARRRAFGREDRLIAVPVDSRLESKAKAWLVSPDIDEERAGADAIAHFHTGANEELLRGLLSDPEHTSYTSRHPRWAAQREFESYPKRFYADEVLSRWGVSVSRAESERAVYRAHHPVNVVWLVASLVCATIVLPVALLWRSSRWKRQTRGLKRVCLVSGSLVIPLCVLWTRSYWRADELLTNANRLNLEIWSYRGGIGFLGMHGASPHHRLMYGSMSIAAQPNAQLIWDPVSWQPQQLDCGAGFVLARGAMLADGWDTYLFCRLPFWALIVLAGALPLPWLYRFARWRGKLRRGICPSCGYDLRATPERCPECGSVYGVERTTSLAAQAGTGDASADS
jgi:hypothetical protein